MRISVRQLRRVIKEAVEGEMGMPEQRGYEGRTIEMSVPSYNQHRVEDIAFKTCPDLFKSYDPAKGIVTLYDPEGDADLKSMLADFVTEIHAA